MKNTFKAGDKVWAVVEDWDDNYHCSKLEVEYIDNDNVYLIFKGQLYIQTNSKNLFVKKGDAKEVVDKINSYKKEIKKLEREIEKLPRVFI
jgi:uncharacterized protein YlzI (FlbEa/FlbD family)